MTRAHAEARTGLRATFRALRDDSGQQVRRISKGDLKRAAKSEHPGVQRIASRLKYAIKSESRRITLDRIAVIVTLVFLIFFITGLFSQLVLPMIGVSGAGIGLLVFVAMIIAAHLVFNEYIRRGALSQLARTAVAEGVCGSCAFPLKDVPQDSDGMIRCPECAAVWHASRVIEPFWVRPPRDRLRGGVAFAFIPGVLPKSSLYAPDDRGRFVQTPDARMRRLPRDTIDQIEPDELGRIRRHARRVGMIPRLLLTLLLSPLPILCAYGAYHALIDKDWIALGFVTFFLLLCGVPVLMIPFGAIFSTPHRTARVIVRHGRCGCCLQPLAKAPGDTEGRASCVECGSAWIWDPPKATVSPGQIGEPQPNPTHAAADR